MADKKKDGSKDPPEEKEEKSSSGGKKTEGRKVSLGQDFIKAATEWIGPPVAKMFLSRSPREWDDKLAALLGPITTTGILRIIPDDKWYSQPAEDLVTAIMKDAQRLIKSGELRAEKPKQAEELGLDEKRFTELMASMLDTVDAFAAKLSDEEREAMFRFLNTANAKVIDAWLRMPDTEKLLRVQAMQRLSSGKAAPKKSKHDSNFFEVLRSRSDVEWDAYWVWLASLPAEDQDLIEEYTSGLKGPQAEIFLRLDSGQRVARAQRHREEDPLEVATASLKRVQVRLSAMADRAKTDVQATRDARESQFQVLLRTKRKGRLNRFFLGR